MQGRGERFTGPKLDGVHLHAVHHGSTGRAKLVLLHGAGANAHWWDHLASGLAKHFQVVALDFRGHGDSDFPEQLRAGAFSDDLDALLQHLSAPEAILIGHSLGALEIVSAIPDARLVEIPGAGHHVHIDRPALVLPAMLEFLSHRGCAGAPPPSDVRRRS